jgi:hypothetical protein
MRAVKKFNRGAINFNVGQYAVGTDGANGFAIADWLGLAAMTINVILEAKISYTYNSAAFPVFYISDSNASPDKTLAAGVGGNWTGSVSNEYITLSRANNPSPVQGYYRASTTESVSGINFITFVSGPTPAIYLNGATVAGSNFNTLALATSGITGLTKLSIGGYHTGGNTSGNMKLRDLSFFPRALTLAEHQSLWTMYGGSQNKLGFDDMTLKAHSLYREAIELYTGRKENNVLIAEKKTSHNLQLMGF